MVLYGHPKIISMGMSNPSTYQFPQLKLEKDQSNILVPCTGYHIECGIEPSYGVLLQRSTFNIVGWCLVQHFEYQKLNSTLDWAWS